MFFNCDNCINTLIMAQVCIQFYLIIFACCLEDKINYVYLQAIIEKSIMVKLIFNK